MAAAAAMATARGFSVPSGGFATSRNIAATAYIATRVEPDEAKALGLLSRAKGHSLSAELRQAIRAHLAAAVEALDDERSAERPSVVTSPAEKEPERAGSG